MVAACELYTLIPYVALFSVHVRELGSSYRHQDFEVIYRRLEGRILSWQDRSSGRLPQMSAQVALIYQNCLLIFLHASYLCNTSDQDDLEATLGPIVADTLSLFESIKNSPPATTAFWPMVILGSCLRNKSDRHRLLNYLTFTGISSGIQVRACEALLWIWNHQAQGAFGPVGLDMYITENQTGLCIG